MNEIEGKVQEQSSERGNSSAGSETRGWRWQWTYELEEKRQLSLDINKSLDITWERHSYNTIQGAFTKKFQLCWNRDWLWNTESNSSKRTRLYVAACLRKRPLKARGKKIMKSKEELHSQKKKKEKKMELEKRSLDVNNQLNFRKHQTKSEDTPSSKAVVGIGFWWSKSSSSSSEPESVSRFSSSSARVRVAVPISTPLVGGKLSSCHTETHRICYV